MCEHGKAVSGQQLSQVGCRSARGAVPPFRMFPFCRVSQRVPARASLARAVLEGCPRKTVVTQRMMMAWNAIGGGQVRDSIAQIAEARTLGGDVAALESRLRSSLAQRQILQENVEKQQSIKKLWVCCFCPLLCLRLCLLLRSSLVAWTWNARRLMPCIRLAQQSAE